MAHPRVSAASQRTGANLRAKRPNGYTEHFWHFVKTERKKKNERAPQIGVPDQIEKRDQPNLVDCKPFFIFSDLITHCANGGTFFYHYFFFIFFVGGEPHDRPKQHAE